MKANAARVWILLCALGLAGPAAADGAPAACETKRLTPQTVDAKGFGVLCRSKAGVRGWLRASNLIPGDAFTVWFVYFDDPTLCAIPDACGAADFGGDNPLGVFGRLDSSIVPERGSVLFGGRVGAFVPSSGSQVWLWLFGHGEADTVDGRRLARQLLTPEDPSAGAPHLGNNVDGPAGFPAAVIMWDIP